MQIKNHDQLKDDLTQIILDFERQLNDYQTDVYLYLNDDGTLRLEKFINVGGNSWKNDDHIRVYSDMPHTDDMMSYLLNTSNGASYSWLIDELEALFNKAGITQETIDACKSKPEYAGEDIVCIEDLDVIDVEQELLSRYEDEIRFYYENVFVQNNVIVIDMVNDVIREIKKNNSYVVLSGNTYVSYAEDYDTALRLAESVSGSRVCLWNNRAVLNARTAAM